MLRLLNVQKAVKDAVEDVIFQARRQLSRKQVYKQNDGTSRAKKIDTTGALWKSLKYTPIEGDGIKTPFTTEVLMAYYGYFIDQGVDGTQHKTPKGSPYSFRTDTVGPSMQYGIFQWMRAKRIRLREAGTGRFAKGKITDKSYESLAYVIARSVKRKGINQTFFMTNALNAMDKKFPAQIEKALAKDIENYLNELNSTK